MGLNATPLQMSGLKLSKPQTQPNLPWICNENDFEHPTPPPPQTGCQHYCQKPTLTQLKATPSNKLLDPPPPTTFMSLL